jgi:B-cell CLL/lymphoma protein 3
MTALHIAVKSGCTKWAELLVEKGASIDKENQDQLRPLHLTAVAEPLLNKIAAMDAKIKNNAIEAKSKNRLTALHQATKTGQVDMVKLLIDSGADIKTKISKGTDAAGHGVGIWPFEGEGATEGGTTSTRR